MCMRNSLESYKKQESDKTAEQCRVKMKKFKIDYRKVKDKHNKTGETRSNWKFFDAIDAVIGHRPTTRPSVVLDTSEQPEQVEKGGLDENDEEDEGFAEQSNTSTSTEEDTRLSSEPSSSSTPKDNQRSLSPSPGIKGKKRKRTKDEKIESIMMNVVKEVVNSQKESDRILMEMEEKRMKYEAEQKKEEQEFQLRMMSMLFCNQSTRLPLDQYGPYHPFPSFSNSHVDM